jgi:hypothetical protein
MESVVERSDSAIGLEALESLRARADDESQLKLTLRSSQSNIVTALAASEVSPEVPPTR